MQSYLVIIDTTFMPTKCEICALTSMEFEAKSVKVHKVNIYFKIFKFMLKRIIMLHFKAVKFSKHG